MTGCYKSELTNTTHPDKGKVEVEVTIPTTNPDTGEQADPEATTPDSYTVILNGEEVEVGEDGSVELPENLEPGEYTIYVYSNTDDLEMENNITETGEGTIVSSSIVDAGMIISLTEDLYFGTQIVTVLADQVITSEVKLKQVTRTVKFNLKITEGDPNRITGITATLGGIAGQWECVEDIPIGDAVKINPAFTQGESISRVAANDYLTSSIKVLGTQGEEQDLTLTLTFSDGTTQEITSPLGEQFKGSNATKSTPLILSNEIETPTETNPTGSIGDWNTTYEDLEAK